eukprot:COSAG02_NODE_297_length_25355_cov_78.632998_12_plen_73_part_00
MRELDVRLRLNFSERVTGKVLASTYHKSQRYEDQYAEWARKDGVDASGALNDLDEVEADETNDTENLDGPQR